MPTVNLVNDFGGVGDAQRETITASITSGTKDLTVGMGVFVSGDVEKALTIWHSSLTNGVLETTITAFTSSTQVTVNHNASATLTGATVDLLWGTDNTSALIGAVGSWRAYAQTQTDPGDIPILEVPDGNYAFGASGAAGSGLHYNVLNSAKITGISGNAADCKIMQLRASEIKFGTDPAVVSNRGLTNSGGNSARLQTALAGAATVTLVDPAGTDLGGSTYGSRIVVGRACLLAAYDLQGLYNSHVGYPPNNFFFEWNKITAYDSGTGVVTLETPLTQAYTSTYPQWGLLNTTSGSDQGGPFTIWVAPDGYNNTITLENFTLDSPHNQSSCSSRHLIVNNVVMSGPALYPTQNDTVDYTDCVFPELLEVDKLTNQVTYNNCTLNQIRQQSSSPNRAIYNGSTIGQLELTKYTEANNCAITTLSCGVSSYGRANRAVFNNCTGITTFNRGGGSTDDLRIAGVISNASDFYEFNAGVMRCLRSVNTGASGQSNITRLFVPGTWIFFDDKYLDQVLDVYEDATYVYIQFADTTDWPFTPVARLKTHPCPDFTMRGCTGTAVELEDWNQAPARIPLYSYSKRTYVAGASATTPLAIPLVFGRPTSIKSTVTSLFTAGTNLSFKHARFDNMAYIKESDYFSVADFSTNINMKIAGFRTVSNAASGTGAQSLDSLMDFTSVGSVWFYGNNNSGPVFSANVTNGDTPTVTAEWIMDQGIPAVLPTAVIPLRFRLRAA